MAFGFGFNKQKVLSAAEKYVQQGKLPNAIAEYEKVLKSDAKDLTVANTVGDLYSRLGESEKATECFKSVGDAYASQGFTVKAIAMYKKISKLKPSLESALKLAELYTQQGLFNDARAQYLQVAEEFLKAGELDNAVRIFQKILEMDPENAAMRMRLAELYIKLGKKKEAWEIFCAAAESLRARGSLSGVEDVLQRMLTLDPGNTYALLMRGKNLVESGDAEGAFAALQKIPDIDSNKDGLRDLLKACLQTGRLSEAGTIANKLLTVHNDLGAISSFADALMQAGQYENALQVYDQHAERLLAENPDKVLENLHVIIGHVRENSASLEKLLNLFHKAGETTHVTEVLELLAHSSVQAGDLPRARDLYQKLATLEPQNTLHMKSYQQVVTQLGGATMGSKLITSEEAAVIVDELEATAPAIHQHYPDEVALAVRSALTDAELFISYNMPAKALGPLVGALPLAPKDVRVNQRLAALHTRAGRFAEAAVCCSTLQNVYSDAGYPEEATRYGELASRYEERSVAVAVDGAAEPGQAETFAELAVEEFGVETAPQDFAVEEAGVEEFAVGEAAETEAASPWPVMQAGPGIGEESGSQEFAVVDESGAATTEAEASAEIDLSSEWDDAITVEADAPAEEAAEIEIADAVGDHEVPSTRADETLEEIRFYLAHSMPEQAEAAFGKLQTLTRDVAKLTGLRAEIDDAVKAAAAEKAAAALNEPVTEIAAEETPAELAVEEIVVAEEAPVEVAAGPQIAMVEEPVAAPIEAVAEVQSEAGVAENTVSQFAASEVVVPEIIVSQAAVPEAIASEIAVPEAVSEIVTAEAPEVSVPEAISVDPAAHEVAPSELQNFVTDLESSLGDSFLLGTVAQAVVEPAVVSPVSAVASELQPVAHVDAAPAVSEHPTPALGEFVADLESSLGDDFLKAAPVATTVVAAVVTAPLAAAAAAGTSGHSTSAVMSAGAAFAPSGEGLIPPAPFPGKGSATAAKSSPFAEDAGIDLAEMFDELKQDLESGGASAEEDPETHYNLGIAFREMGLLDEAIGELQKACQSVDRGHPFPQVSADLYLLAQCFLDKGVPEAAVRWYNKALTVPGIDGETRTALNYELAAAYETAGDRPQAIKHFMEVYGTNIDYRDVAERIKALKP